MNLTITGYSTALFSTWYFIEELDLLFDAGDGISAGLLQKSRKIKHVFISHADRDHITGLMQLNQLNARPGFPKIYYPADSSSFPAMQGFLSKFDPQSQGTEWTGIKNGDEVKIAKDVIVKVIRNNHVRVAEDVHKSFSFLVQRIKQKLKSEFLHLSDKEIAALRQSHSSTDLLYEVRENIIGYSGDTPLEDFTHWQNVGVLIHEATFLDRTNKSISDTRVNPHSYLDEVLAAAAKANIGQLILGHFSSRYSAEEIEQAVATGIARNNIQFPVHIVLPGEKFMQKITMDARMDKGQNIS